MHTCTPCQCFSTLLYGMESSTRGKILMVGIPMDIHSTSNILSFKVRIQDPLEGTLN